MFDVTKPSTGDDAAYLRGQYLAMFIYLEDRMTTAFHSVLDQTEDKRVWQLLRSALLDPLNANARIALLESIIKWEQTDDAYPTLISDLRVANTRRNYFAHYAIFFDPDSPEPWAFGTPFTVRKREGRRAYDFRISNKEMQQWFDEIQATMRLMHAFAESMARRFS